MWACTGCRRRRKLAFLQQSSSCGRRVDCNLHPHLHETFCLTSDAALQLYAMAYGTVPIVHAVGGLRDTVKPFNAADETGGQRGGWCLRVSSPGVDEQSF